MNRYRALILGLITVFLVLSSSLAFSGERFTDNGDGTVTDHQLGVMWAKNDNQGNIDWRQAEKYCRWTFPYLIPTRYDNWRMPTIEELASLFVRDKSYKGYETDCGRKVKVVPEIRLSCGWVWASEPMTIDFEMKGKEIKRRTISAKVYNFQRGYPYTDLMRHSKDYRALPVRDLQDGK
ncbi:MAG: DUF1566 domain-containing protein [Syntrophobacterales bacterium]|jgi:hypothetical protein|nr:MAG: DUF1566 domain-containing protein [Deltaproteobacteria bacterium]